MKLFGIIEIEARLIAKRSRVRKALLKSGRLHAVKVCRDLYGYSLKDALDFVRRMEEAEG